MTCKCLLNFFAAHAESVSWKLSSCFLGKHGQHGDLGVRQDTEQGIASTSS